MISTGKAIHAGPSSLEDPLPEVVTECRLHLNAGKHQWFGKYEVDSKSAIYEKLPAVLRHHSHSKKMHAVAAGMSTVPSQMW